jgi:hypothetical protein
MKAFKFVLILLAIPFFGVYAQRKITVISANDLSKPGATNGTDLINTDNNLDKYVGSWLWKDGNKQLKLKLTKAVHHAGRNGHTFDLTFLKGEYSYMVDGKVVLRPSKEHPAMGTSAGKRDTVDLLFENDEKKPVTVTYLYLTYVNTKTLHLELHENVFEHNNDSHFELPLPLTLTQVVK